MPPVPPRPASPLRPLELIRTARRNLLEIWTEQAFEYEFFSSRLLTRRVFVCNSPDTVRQVLVDDNETYERKSPQMRNALRPLIGDGLFISDGEIWKRRRKLVAPVVHASKLPIFAPMMTEVAAETADRWAGLSQPARIDVLKEMASLTAEIICRTVFGRQLGREFAHEMIDGFSAYQQHIEQTDVMSLFRLPDWVPRLRGRQLARSIRRIHATLDGIIGGNHHHHEHGEGSMMELLIEADGGGGSPALSARALRNEAATLFMAGHETTANSLAWTWYLLSQSPRVESALHAELDTVLAGRAPTYEDLPQLPYTRAVYEEALRLYPPVPLLSREAVRDGLIRGRPVKKGSIVMVVPWLLHRHRKLWEQPDHFVPERFLPENAAGRSKYVYIPFSIGPRNCAGAAFGLTEGVLCLATQAQRFSLRLDRANPVMPVCRLTLRPDGGLQMIAVSRPAGRRPAAA